MSNRSVILSFCLSGHGFSGAVCINGQIVCATTLERLTREKYDILLPLSKADLETFGWHGDPAQYQANTTLPFDLTRDDSRLDFRLVPNFKLLLDYLLTGAGITMGHVDAVAWSYRHNESARRYFAEYCPTAEFIIPEHHYSHACQAYLPSGFDEAAILVLDGQGVPMQRTTGDQLSGLLAYGQGSHIEVLEELPARHSLGAMYAAFTHTLGFATNEDGKTMGLAPYGTPNYYQQLQQGLLFNQYEGWRGTVKGLLKGRWPQPRHYQLPRYWELLEGFKPRHPKDYIDQSHKDLAYAAQALTEQVMIYLATYLHSMTGSRNLCIAGGVGLNCVANYEVLEQAGFQHIFIHPSAGDNGLAIGQALHVHQHLWKQPAAYHCTADELGKRYTELRIRDAVQVHKGHTAEYFEWASLYLTVASAIAEGKIVAWYQGGSEFGPRALGHRSILADPRNPNMKDILNSRVKHREAFRPFTPSVLDEHAVDWFDLNEASPFMLLAPAVKRDKQKQIPAVTHVDGTARVQTVTHSTNEHYYNLIQVFEKLTGVPMVLNTSFNVAGEPIVETPEDAVRCFQSTDIDLLCIGPFVLSKVDQTSHL